MKTGRYFEFECISQGYEDTTEEKMLKGNLENRG